MPHIHLETTADLPENAHVPDILDALTAELCRHESIQPASVKAYHSLQSVWVMGDGATPGFAHCTVAILEGRTEPLRIAISDGMIGVMNEQFSESLAAGDVQLTLELREMTASTYRK